MPLSEAREPKQKIQQFPCIHWWRLSVLSIEADTRPPSVDDNSMTETWVSFAWIRDML